MQVVDCIFMQGIFFCVYEVRKYFDLSTDMSQEDSKHLRPTKCESPVSFFSMIPAVGKKNKTKQNCWILQNPPVKDNSPHQHTLTQRWWHLAPHSNLLLPRFVRVFFFLIFHLLRCLTPVPPCFPSKTFLFALYISALSPFCPLFFYMSIFLSFLFHFLPTYPFPILSLSLSILAWLCRRASPFPCLW